MANRSALARATDSSDAPTPGYLYLDIAKNAASSPAACSDIATYLTRRLSSKNNPNIKFKCLKVIAKTAESPVTRGHFKRVVSQDAQAVACIKEALNFRGVPDPARGDEPNQRVRVAAKEALDAVYSDTPASSEHTSANAGLAGGGMAASYGASPHFSSNSSAPPPQSSSSRRMEGIGNPMFSDPRMSGGGADQKNIGNMTIGEVVSVAGETIAGMIKDPLARNVPEYPQHQRGGMPGYGSSSSGGSYGAPPPGSSQLAQQTRGEWTMASNRGPNSINQNSEYYKARDANAFSWAQQQQQSQQQNSQSAPSTMGGVGGSWGSVSTAVPASKPSVASQARAPPHGGNFAPPPTSGSGGTAVSDGSYEKNLIMELCPPGGMKAEPPPDKLAAFTRSVPSLNPDLVCPALLDALEDGQPWLIRAKALCVMEVAVKVMENSGKGNNNPYADFFHVCRGEIEPLASHPRAAIRDPAKRVLQALGIDDAAAAPAAAAAAPVAAPPPVPNLLDFENEPTTTAEPSATPPTAPVAAPPPPKEKSSGGDSLFGGMKVKSTGSKEQAAPASTTTESLLGDTPAPESSSAASEAQDVGKAAATTGSAFGFINSGGDGAPAAAAESGDTQKKEKEAEAETKKQPPSKESFDPLLSMGSSDPSPNNTAAKQTMQLSTAQMQAMAYQQMMMQQQMQMQQMQIAYAMQQQHQMGGTAAVPGGMPQAAPQPGGNMMGSPRGSSSHRSVMSLNSSAGAAASSSFSFLDVSAKPPPKEDKKFDFVKDALKNESKK